MSRITERTIVSLKTPKSGNIICYDPEVHGFGVRVTAGGVKSFVLNYRIHGRERRFTIGRHPDLTATAARDQAITWRARIAQGEDPLERRRVDREASTVKELAQDYLENYAKVRKRSKSVADDKANIDGVIVPHLGSLKVAAVTRRDIEALHNSMKGTPYRANRILALMSKMFGRAVEDGLRPDSPVRGVAKFPEHARKRWLSEDELDRLEKALGAYGDQECANAVRLLLLTGARKTELLSASWTQFDLKQGIWSKPNHATKQRRDEVVPLNDEAVAILKSLKATAKSDFVFPNREGKGGAYLGAGHRRDVRDCWNAVRIQAKLQDVHLHDLRHTFASHLVSRGMSLHIVGRLLGHTQPSTTNRYAHLANHSLREATNMAGQILAKK
jgi:integrase